MPDGLERWLAHSAALRFAAGALFGSWHCRKPILCHLITEGGPQHKLCSWMQLLASACFCLAPGLKSGDACLVRAAAVILTNWLVK
jgi:hypothetical protein